MPVKLDEILPGLYLGPWEHAYEPDLLAEHNITHILSAMKMPRDFAPAPHVKWLSFRILDAPTFNILELLPQCVDWLIKARESGGNVYVHCQAGISRSATVVAAYIIQTEKQSVESALDFIKSKRKCIQPNTGFRHQLTLWHAEKVLRTSDDQATRLFYHEQTVRESRAGKGVSVHTDMLARVTAMSGAGTGNRIRCKMCRHELAKRDHMFPHGTTVEPAVSLETEATTSIEVASNEDDASTASSLVVTASTSVTPTPAHQPMIQPACSGYFVEPLDWMQPILSEGQTSGRLDCPNTRCRAKLGSYDWAGAKCACGHWVVPSFCIHRSRVDEMK